MKKNLFLLAMAALASTSALQAQNNATASSSVAAANVADFSDFELVPEETVTYSNRTDFNWEEFEIELDETQVNWTFHTDLANRLLYIDFEALGGKMSALQLQSANGNTLFEDKQLSSLPKNTIYEVNLKKLAIGNYFVLLHTYTGIIRQEIRITE